MSISERVGDSGDAPAPQKPSAQFDVVPERAAIEIRWPNVLGIESVVQPALTKNTTNRLAPIYDEDQPIGAAGYCAPVYDPSRR